MEVEFRLTREDYYKEIRRTIVNRHGVRKIYFVCFVCLFSLTNGNGSTPNSVAMFFRFLCLFSLSTICVYFIPYLLAMRKARKAFVEKPSLLEKKKILLRDDEFEVQSAKENGKRSYSITSASMMEDYIRIDVPGVNSYLIPKSAFSDRNDAANFFEKLSRGIAKYRPGVKVQNKPYVTKNPRRMYYWGLLGLVPMVGFFAGIVLILRGIFDFKDKWMVFIGVGGISFTVLVYSCLVNVTGSSPLFRQNYIMITNSQMNTLVKGIEFYKIQNGVYPDSLQQVTKQEAFTSIYDPFLFNTGKQKAGIFHYQNLGNKYTLFSVGPDGLPNTADDIYPNLKINDTSKCGLVINRAGQ